MGARGTRTLSIFHSHLLPVPFEVKLIINNSALTCVIPDTIKTFLSPKHLLFGYLADNYPTITPRVFHVFTNLTILSRTTDKIKGIINHFWDRWRHEYVVNLREA